MGGFQGSDAAAIYCAAKAAVNNLSESYNKSLKKYGIGVSVCCPANIKSNIAEATFTRPDHLKNTGYVVNDDSINSLRRIHSAGMEPTELAGHIKRGIEDEQLYIIPYPEEKETLERHFKEIVDSVLPMEADPEGARHRKEALQAWAAERRQMVESSNETAKQ